MEALLVPKNFVVQSHKGPYEVNFTDDLLSDVRPLSAGEPHFIVDEKVANLYSKELSSITNHANTILVQATEDNKSLDQVSNIVNQLVIEYNKKLSPFSIKSIEDDLFE